MWEQKKVNAPQVYNPMYGLNAGQQGGQLPAQQMALNAGQEQHMQQQQRQQQLQHIQHMQQMQQYQQMSAALSQPLGQGIGQGLSQGLGQGLGPPPPYTPYAESQQQHMKYMSQMAYPNQYMGPNVTLPPVGPQPTTQPNPAANYPNPYPYQTPGLYQYNPYPSLPPNSTVVMPQGFDAGARFDGIARPVIPPPPPGAVANAAQLAVMQGQNAVVGQKKSSFLEGGSSGGYTFW